MKLTVTPVKKVYVFEDKAYISYSEYIDKLVEISLDLKKFSLRRTILKTLKS